MSRWDSRAERRAAAAPATPRGDRGAVGVVDNSAGPENLEA